MRILNDKLGFDEIRNLKDENPFDDMIKCVADIERGIIAVGAELHSDLEEMLLENGSKQTNLYGFNIVFDDDEIEFDSMINPPRNREDGYPRGGRYVSSIEKRRIIEEIVDKWIEK